MRSIGIRELRQRASVFLRLVEGGETVEITDRGRPVAHLVPIQDASPLDRLRDQGRLTEPDGDLADLGPPLAATSGESPSQRLAAARADER